MNQDATRPAPPRLSYSVAEASRATGIGRTTLYKLMGDGSLSSVKIGNRRLIPASALQAILQAA